jgi:hypothetical protein
MVFVASVWTARMKALRLHWKTDARAMKTNSKLCVPVLDKIHKNLIVLIGIREVG